MGSGGPSSVVSDCGVVGFGSELIHLSLLIICFSSLDFSICLNCVNLYSLNVPLY